MRNNIQRSTSKAGSLLIASPPIQFTAKVQFGAPSNNCNNYGICRLELLESFGIPETTPCLCSKYYTATISYLEPNQLTIRFAKKDLDDKVIQKHFNRNFFTVEEDFSKVLHLATITATQNLTIDKGQYPIVETQEDLIIAFF